MPDSPSPRPTTDGGTREIKLEDQACVTVDWSAIDAQNPWRLPRPERRGAEPEFTCTLTREVNIEVDEKNVHRCGRIDGLGTDRP
jgi:hypothetical protein